MTLRGFAGFPLHTVPTLCISAQTTDSQKLKYLQELVLYQIFKITFKLREISKLQHSLLKTRKNADLFISKKSTTFANEII